jgi:hypothetical protein
LGLTIWLCGRGLEGVWVQAGASWLAAGFFGLRALASGLGSGCGSMLDTMFWTISSGVRPFSSFSGLSQALSRTLSPSTVADSCRIWSRCYESV